jgi:hypothetical protein
MKAALSLRKKADVRPLFRKRSPTRTKLWETLVLFGCIALAALITFAGCATTPDNGGGGRQFKDPAAAAAKLAANINAVKAGSAKANGDTVTLSGWVGLKKRLTVPEGVTLDLTAEGTALELQDGAALTVNGTVNARGHGNHGSGWVEGSLRVGDGAALIDGTGTVYLASKGRLFNIGSDRGRRTLTLDGVTLVGLPDNDHSLVGIGENNELVLKSGAITGNTRSGDEWVSGGGVEVSRGTFTMESGVISGNSVSGGQGAEGGGVKVGRKGNFTMKGGTITGNSLNPGRDASSGGGVRVGEGGTFIMEGGTISGNTVTGGRTGHGAGVSVFGEGSSFIMHGGAISDNTVTGGPGGGCGGGVMVLRGNPKENRTGPAFTMTGGTISGNAVSGGSWNEGGGVQIGEDCVFVMKGGVISGNTVTAMRGTSANGGGVRVQEGGTFTMEGGTIYGKAESLPAGADANLANHAPRDVSLYIDGTVKWGTGGAYTKGGVPQTGGGDIGSTDDTLIAIPAQ